MQQHFHIILQTELWRGSVVFVRGSVGVRPVMNQPDERQLQHDMMLQPRAAVYAADTQIYQETSQTGSHDSI